MREELALRIDELGYGMRVHPTAERHYMKLVKFVDIFEECFSVWTNFSVVPRKVEKWRFGSNVAGWQQDPDGTEHSSPKN